MQRTCRRFCDLVIFLVIMCSRRTYSVLSNKSFSKYQNIVPPIIGTEFTLELVNSRKCYFFVELCTYVRRREGSYITTHNYRIARKKKKCESYKLPKALRAKFKKKLSVFQQQLQKYIHVAVNNTTLCFFSKQQILLSR